MFQQKEKQKIQSLEKEKKEEKRLSMRGKPIFQFRPRCQTGSRFLTDKSHVCSKGVKRKKKKKIKNSAKPKESNSNQIWHSWIVGPKNGLVFQLWAIGFLYLSVRLSKEIDELLSELNWLTWPASPSDHPNLIPFFPRVSNNPMFWRKKLIHEIRAISISAWTNQCVCAVTIVGRFPCFGKNPTQKTTPSFERES